MRVAVLGATGFIGPAIATALAAAGRDVVAVSRGHRPLDDLPEGVTHRTADRLDPAGLRAALDDADAVVDVVALSADDADALVAAAPPDARVVVLSSIDVYRAFTTLGEGGVTDPIPLTEDAPVRTSRRLRRDSGRMEDYEKLDVEDRVLDRGATVLRLPFVIGPRDAQRREEPILRRVRARRMALPIGSAAFTGSRVLVDDVGAGVAGVLDAPPDRVTGRVFNLAEAASPSMRLWTEWILAEAGADIELVRVPDDALPADLGLWGHLPQSLVVTSTRAVEAFDWSPTDPRMATRRSVAWHLANPPEDPDTIFTDDDTALASAD